MSEFDPEDDIESRNIKQNIRFINIQLFEGVLGNNKRQARGRDINEKADAFGRSPCYSVHRSTATRTAHICSGSFRELYIRSPAVSSQQSLQSPSRCPQHQQSPFHLLRRFAANDEI